MTKPNDWVSHVRSCIGILGLAAWCCLAAEPVTLVDFAKKGHGWKGNPRTQEVPDDGGFAVELTGDDPWLEGPAVALPGFGVAQKLSLALEAECASAGAFQLFYALPGKGFSEDAALRLNRSASSATTYQGFMPLTAEKARFRLDPPGSAGRVRLRELRAVPLVALAAPLFEKPAFGALPEKTLLVEAGSLRVVHDPKRWNALQCSVGGQKMAEANPNESLAYVEGSKVVPVPLADSEVSSERLADGFVVRAKVRDAGGALWQVTRRFAADKGAVRIETSVEIDAPREVIHLPWLTLFAGVGSFGETKSQALLPGVEYLDNEPSSNEKEIRGPSANRRLTDRYKVCYPLMALAAGGHWLSVAWHAGEVPVSPVFDSPDRVFHSGGHVLGVWSPAVGAARFESELVVYGGVPLKAGRAVTCAITVSGGKGNAVTESVGDYVARVGLPPLPTYAGGFDGAVRLLAAGWLDSAARDGLLWRHAVWGHNFPAQPAQDPPAFMLWLAAQASDAALKERLQECSRRVIESLPKGCFGTDGISHVRRPTGALLYGNLEGLVKQAGPRAREIAKRLADGTARYTPSAKADYASTLGSDHCNGYTAMSAEEMLSSATLTGDEAAIAAALASLDKMTAQYAGQVPRGAQPLEMPLHTPDIVAAARLVRCYVLGYLLSGRQDYLEQARYWAWTGVTMVYLTPPTEGAVGLYATIGVIGATSWVAPNWIGQPVQWCGLVYRSALEDLARVDEAQRSTWQTLARGITITGLQMCFPVGDQERRGGLLPDYFLLKSQVSDGPAINPGTLQTHLAEAYGKTPQYSVTRLSNGVLAHLPGEVRQEPSGGGTLKLTVTAWPESEYRVLLTRLGKTPGKVLWNGVGVETHYLEAPRALIVPLKGSGLLELAL
jgi:hypothetical protein